MCVYQFNCKEPWQLKLKLHVKLEQRYIFNVKYYNSYKLLLLLLIFILNINYQVIAAQGEHNASRALREAAEVIGDSPAALQLRYLQVN